MPDHIKIRDTTPRVQYVTDGFQRSFVYPFPIFHEDDLKVFLDNGQIVNGFRLFGVGDSDGGTVLFDAAPEADRVLTLRRVVPVQRVTDFLQGGELRADSFNDEFDHQAAIAQQIDDTLGRTLHAPSHDRPALLEVP